MTRFLKYGTIISSYLLVGSVLLQIFARFFLSNTPPWTEEASRLFFIYAMAFASGLALKNNYYVYLELFYDKFSPKTQRKLLHLIYLFTILLFMIMSIGAVQFILLGISENSPSMKISMSTAFCSMLLMAVSIGYFAIDFLLKTYKKSK